MAVYSQDLMLADAESMVEGVIVTSDVAEVVKVLGPNDLIAAIKVMYWWMRANHPEVAGLMTARVLVNRII